MNHSSWGAACTGMEDVNGGQPEVVAAPLRRGPRRWPWSVACAVLAAALILAGVAAWHNRDSAEGWRERANAFEAQLEETRRQLTLSEADVDLLESRLQQLAAEKAQVEDEREFVARQRDLYERLAAMTNTAATDLRRCLEEWQRVTRLVVAGEVADEEAFRREAQQVDRVCAAAEASHAELTAFIATLRE